MVGLHCPIIGARIRFLTVRQAAALAVAVLAIDAVLSGIAQVGAQGAAVRAGVTEFPLETHLLSVIAGLGLLALTPRLWRGTRTAAALAGIGLATLATLTALRGHWSQTAVELCLCALLVRARGSFPLGSRNRPRAAVVCAALGAWGLAYIALRFAPLASSHAAHLIARTLRHPVAYTLTQPTIQGRLNTSWLSAIEMLIGCAAIISVLAMRSLLRPLAAENEPVEHEYRAARAIIDQHGQDSLSPFMLRPDKALQFAAGGVLSYRVIRGTAIVSSDPVAPHGAAAEVLSAFLPVARARGWQVALWAASPRHLDGYRALGLRAVCVGEEAFVDPARFTLEGRPVRKLRQSVHRVARRGWEISVCEGRAIDAALEAEINALEQAWRARRPRLHGFAMGMGPFDSDLRPDDLYALARSPRRRARRRDALHQPLRKALLGHDAPGRRDPERTQRGPGLRNPESGTRARRGRGEPQLRRPGPRAPG